MIRCLLPAACSSPVAPRHALTPWLHLEYKRQPCNLEAGLCIYKECEEVGINHSFKLFHSKQNPVRSQTLLRPSVSASASYSRIPRRYASCTMAQQLNLLRLLTVILVVLTTTVHSVPIPSPRAISSVELNHFRGREGSFKAWTATHLHTKSTRPSPTSKLGTGMTYTANITVART
jgi:hypothetical protein